MYSFFIAAGHKSSVRLILEFLSLFLVGRLMTRSYQYLECQRWKADVLLQDSLDPIQALLEGLHCGSIRKADEVVARAVKQIPSLGRIQVKENPWDD